MFQFQEPWPLDMWLGVSLAKFWIEKKRHSLILKFQTFFKQFCVGGLHRETIHHHGVVPVVLPFDTPII